MECSGEISAILNEISRLHFAALEMTGKKILKDFEKILEDFEPKATRKMEEKDI